MARTITSTTTAESSRNRGVLLVAAAFAIVTAALVFAFLNSQGGSGSSSPSGVDDTAENAVVLTRNVGAGEKISEDMISVRPVSRSALLAGRYASTEGIVGKVTTTPLFAGEQLIEAKITTYSGQNTLAYKVPEGMRAISLQVPHEAWIAGGLPQPGDRVDVLGISTIGKTDPLTGTERPDAVAGYIAQDVEVLAISQKLVKTVPNIDAKKNAGVAAGGTPVASEAVVSGKPLGDAETYQMAISITLALSPELAAKVAIIDAMKDDIAQYRILPRRKGESDPLAGKKTWSFEEVFDVRTK